MIKTLSPRIKTLDTRTAKSVPSTQRIRGSGLQIIRKRIMARDEYLCQACLIEGRYTAGTEVDHKVPLHLGGAESDSNRWLLCGTCHDAKSEVEEAERRGLIHG